MNALNLWLVWDRWGTQPHNQSLEVLMKKTFYVGTNQEHKIDVDFRFSGNEKIYVNDVLVIDNRNLSLKGTIAFEAGDHEVTIKSEGNLKEWSCSVFVDGALFIEELFDEELRRHKKRVSNLPKFIKFLCVVVFVVLLLSFLKGFLNGISGG